MDINWSEVIEFCGAQHIVLKAFLNGSTIDVSGSNLNVYLKSKSKFMLEQKKANIIIEEHIKDKYGLELKTSFWEDKCIQDSLSKEKEIVKNILENRTKLDEKKETKPSNVNSNFQDAPQYLRKSK